MIHPEDLPEDVLDMLGINHREDPERQARMDALRAELDLLKAEARAKKEGK